MVNVISHLHADEMCVQRLSVPPKSFTVDWSVAMPQ